MTKQEFKHQSVSKPHASLSTALNTQLPMSHFFLLLTASTKYGMNSGCFEYYTESKVV